MLLEQIALGGMSSVFKAADIADGHASVAVKVPLAQYSSGVGSWSMFQREAQIGTSLAHPGLVRFVDLGPSGERAYIVTEYLAGYPLAAIVRLLWWYLEWKR